MNQKEGVESSALHPSKKATAVAWTPLEAPPDLSRAGIYAGTSGYYYDDWIGVFNPPRSRAAATQDEADRLRFYQRYFSFVEINNTFYREPLQQYFTDVCRRSRESMHYSVKVYRDISHTREWNIDKGVSLINGHIAAVAPLVETGRFYSFLIQLEDHVHRSSKVLEYLCRVASVAVRRRLDVHIEFRHISWHTAMVLQALKDNGIGICNTDIPPVEHAFPLKTYATSDKGYVRYSGRNLGTWNLKAPPSATPRQKIAVRNARYDYLYSDAELAEHVADQIKIIHKTSTIAIAYNNHYQAQAVKNSIENLKLLREYLDCH